MQRLQLQLPDSHGTSPEIVLKQYLLPPAAAANVRSSRARTVSLLRVSFLGAFAFLFIRSLSFQCLREMPPYNSPGAAGI